MKICMEKSDFITLCFLLLFSQMIISEPQCFDLMPQVPDTSELPLCGNGVLDTNELCDDGNRQNFDGCNAWCNAYDGITSACTMAGKNMPCPSGRTEMTTTAHPAKVTFCNLRAIDIDPVNGKYILIADSTSILRMDLFTDQPSSSLYLLNVNSERQFNPICSITIFPDDLSFLIYECTSNNNQASPSLLLSLIPEVGYGHIPVADFNGLFHPTHPTQVSPPPKILLLPGTRDVLIAGVSTNSSSTTFTAFDMCIDIYRIHVPTYSEFQSYSASSNTLRGSETAHYNKNNLNLTARIPCIIYNVAEGQRKHTTYSTKGMIPKYMAYDQCIHSYIFDTKCFVLYMERDDMHFLTAFIPEYGGYDISYTVSTGQKTEEGTMDNVLGLPLIRRGSNEISKMKYTLRGACFQAKSETSTRSSRSPPVVSLGNICNNGISNELGCTTPFNNPFITDIVSSPYLLPEALNSLNTHWELSQIFDQITYNNTQQQTISSSSGAFFYKTILKNMYANSTPIDFVEIPTTHDIIYITPISIGLIGTKQFQLFDPKNRGYCKPTDMIFCPPNHFGSVSHGICSMCNDTNAPGFGISVGWQIKCAATTLSKLSKYDKTNFIAPNLLNVEHATPAERYSTLISKNVNDVVMYEAVCAYLQIMNLSCPDKTQTGLTPKQQFNSAADMESQEYTNIMNGALSSNSSTTTTTSFIQNLINKAESRLERSLTPKEYAGEYLSTWTSPGDTLLKATSSIIETINTQGKELRQSRSTTNHIIPNKTMDYNETALINTCLFNPGVNQLKVWLQCSIPFLLNATSLSVASKSRRLLSVFNDTINDVSGTRVNANQDPTLISSTPIIHNPNSIIQNTPLPISPPKETTGPETFPIWAGVLVGITSGLILVVIIFLLCKKKTKKMMTYSD